MNKLDMAAVYRKAAATLSPNNWGKGKWCVMTPGRWTRMCGGGFILHTAGVPFEVTPPDFVASPPPAGSVCFQPADDYDWASILEPLARYLHLERQARYHTVTSMIYIWNDSPHRTIDEVIMAFEGTAAMLETEHWAEVDSEFERLAIRELV